MALLSKTEAAKRAGVSRPTFYRYIKHGKVSVTKNKDGSESIDTEELLRVFGELKDPDNVMGDVKETVTTLQAETPPETQGENLELLKYKVEALEKQLEEEKVRSKKLLDIVESTTLALPKPEAVKKGFFNRLFNND